jgi:hypothetical protein
MQKVITILLMILITIYWCYLTVKLSLNAVDLESLIQENSTLLRQSAKVSKKLSILQLQKKTGWK